MLTTHRSLAPRVDRQTALIGFAAVAFAISYAGVAARLVDQWSTNYLYSYGFAVPFISLYIVWARWPQLREQAIAPDYLIGVPLTLAGALMLIVGQIGAFITLQELSLVVTVVGIVLLLFGRAVFALAWFPILYLLLMVPIWNYPIGRLQVPSQILSGKIAVRLLDVAGIPGFQEGTIVTLPGLTLEILQECSGVNQLIAVFAMALPAAFVLLTGTLRRVTLLVTAVAIAYLTNGLRIALIGYMAVNGWTTAGQARGPMHLLQGLAVSLVGYAIIGACLSLLVKTEPRRASRSDAADTSRALAPIRRRPWLEPCALAILLASGLAAWTYRPVAVELQSGLPQIPSRIADWTVDVAPARSRFPAVDDAFVGSYPTESGERRFTVADDELVRTYRSATGEKVHLFIGYHRYQTQGKEIAGDASKALEAAATPVELQLHSDTVELNEIVRRESRSQRGMIFWYDLNGRVVRNIYIAKAYSLLDAFTRRRSNGAVIVIAWECPPTADFEVSRRKAMGFAQALLPILPRHIPS